MHQPWVRRALRRPAGRTRVAVAVVIALIAGLVAAEPSTGADGGSTGNLTAAVARAAVLPEGRAGMAAVYDTGSDAVYLLGGYGASCGTTCTTKSLTDEVLRYDPYVDRFDIAPPLLDANGDPLHLALAATVDVPGRGIYLFGGITTPGAHTNDSCSGACNVSNAIRRYDPETGDTTTLAATLPSARDRGAAVYDDDTGLIYIVGGESTDAAFGTEINQLLAFDPGTGQLVGSPRTLPAHGHYTAAAYVPYTRAADDPMASPQFVHPGPMDHGHLLLMGTAGLVEYYPTSPDAPFNFYDFSIGDIRVGSSWVYEAGKQAVFAAGGFCGTGSGCPSTYSDSVNARGPNLSENAASQLPIGADTVAGNLDGRSQLDGAAAYVPALDRMISF